MKVIVIDGQGGKMGRTVVDQLKKKYPTIEILAIGTNSIATASMLKAGADYGATGENPVIVGCEDADLIIGPIGIVIANSLFGEVTPKMACAVGHSKAKKLFIPVNRCNHYIVGVQDLSLSDYIEQIISKVGEFLNLS